MSKLKPKLIRITTVPQSLRGLIRGQMQFMKINGFEVIGVSSSGEALDDTKENEKVRVVAIEMTRTISPLQDLKSLYKLYKLFRIEKPDIVHTHTPKAGTLGMIAARFAKVPHRLHTVAGLPLLETTGNKRKLLNTVEKITYLCATKIYPNSYGLQDIIIANKFTDSLKLKVLADGSSNGINTEYFNPLNYSDIDKNALRQKLNIDLNDFVFIFVGRLVSDKGLNELIDAFSQLTKMKNNVKLLLVGAVEKDLDPLSGETLITIDNNPSILAVGYQQDVRSYFSISDCLVFPSYREGFPNVVMQAGAMGIPSIVSNINGCNEIVQNGKNGIVIPVKNMAALKDAMVRMTTDSLGFEKMKNNSREMIMNRYEQIYVWNALLLEYNSLSKHV